MAKNNSQTRLIPIVITSISLMVQGINLFDIRGSTTTSFASRHQFHFPLTFLKNSPKTTSVTHSNDMNKNAMEDGENNLEDLITGPVGMDFKVGDLDPRTGSSSSGNTRVVPRLVRDVTSISGNPSDKSVSMPLADHSTGTSRVERPTSFVDWSQAPIEDANPQSSRNSTDVRNMRLVDGPSMALAVLLGDNHLWQWDDVVKTPPFTKTGDVYYGVYCCTKLPYICGVDGLCILEHPRECELFCQCASDRTISHCPRTIQRIKTVMRKLEHEIIKDIAIEKRMVLPPTLEKQLEMLESSTTTRNTPSWASPLTPSTPYYTHVLDTLPSTTRSKTLQSNVFSSHNTRTTTLLTTTELPTRKRNPSTPVLPPRMTDVSTLNLQSNLDSIVPRQETISNFPSVGKTELDEIIDGGLGFSKKDKSGTKMTSSVYKQNTDVVEAVVTRPENATYDNCWRCEETGGACVMGNDFRAHCVKGLADGCVHFRCIHGSCISTDGTYSCECLEGWVGPFCDQPCPLHCGHNGYCARMGRAGASNNSLLDDFKDVRSLDDQTGGTDGGVACVCYWNFTGDRCDRMRKLIPSIQRVLVPGDQMDTWQVIVVAISTTIFLASFLITLTYFLWRRRWLPLRKLVFFFQDYEDDDGKQYDAFISYKGCPRDERFVLNHLYPKLEKELDFRLCLHFRDFPPGHPIANNIIHAIENSRRTIMILSPAYIKSEWCRMEYQKAQHEMLRLRHRLIPVVLEDISDLPGVDTNLKTIMETVTYIKWPGEMENAYSKSLSQFWKLLELSMPKKKPDCDRSVTSSDSDASTPSITSSSRTYFHHLVDSLSRYSVTTDSNFLLNVLGRDKKEVCCPNISSELGGEP